ncbi:hypothetical protein [Longimicrobium sp.]|uniref:hypothetical protein n=1 Tax=Longimicrobium sp. TaxID=2029185 RepID=UPI002ED7C4DA
MAHLATPAILSLVALPLGPGASCARAADGESGRTDTSAPSGYRQAGENMQAGGTAERAP